MTKTIILGNTPATAKIIEDIRAAGQENEITVWMTEKNLPYDPARFADYVSGCIPFAEVLCRQQKFYKDTGVRLVLAQDVQRINFRKRQLANTDREVFDFDYLVIAGALQRRFPEIKGVNKYGVVDVKKFDDIEQFVKSFPFIDTVVIQTQTMDGLIMAAAVLKAKKEVIVIIPAAPSAQGEAFTAKVKELEEAGGRVLAENSITEILGDADARAVKLASGKVFACEAVLFDETVPQCKLFADSPLKMTTAITVDQALRTSIKNVFACGEAVEQETEDSVEQGRIIAANILGQDIAPAEETAAPAAETAETAETAPEMVPQEAETPADQVQQSHNLT